MNCSPQANVYIRPLNSAVLFILCSVGLKEMQRHSLGVVSSVIKYKQWKEGPVGQERWLLLPSNQLKVE